ncbi:MAG: hypothetical protein FD155_715 [Bacteroidetes bacterium]|nr:MAG: hypothetical protein FD155_715 [Bacteroidota bacterium]
MLNYYYRSDLLSFEKNSNDDIIGKITNSNQFSSTMEQNKSWADQIVILKKALKGHRGEIFFEFSVPRMGKRIDALVIIKGVVFVIEFKVGEHKFFRSDMDQVWDYALDLKNFHEPSHQVLIAPILVSSEAQPVPIEITTKAHDDQLLYPILTNKNNLGLAIQLTLDFYIPLVEIDPENYAKGRYAPTPTIIEAALALYKSHQVDEITRMDADATNLTHTTSALHAAIKKAGNEHKKIICFVTGVPGAGKTLVGLKVATTHQEQEKKSASVYLSGNGPLVAILQEALARDKVKTEALKGQKIIKSHAKSEIKAFIQNIHHYRDAYLIDKRAPYDHVAIFDEAQRAWNKEQTVNFMKRKKGQPDFQFSEPEFLISCLDRHEDWAVVICLVGGGQEINTGEAGISEWLQAIKHLFPHWLVYISPNLTDSEYAATEAIEKLSKEVKVHFDSALHLAVSMRSFRAEKLSFFVKQLLDREHEKASATYKAIEANYPIKLTRDLQKAKTWLKEKARGNERYGMVVSSQAYRLKPYAIDVKSPVDPIYWFLDGKEDVRSSYFLEDVVTEFHVQGLELDWVCVAWDGDLRSNSKGWSTYSFRGNKWQNINKAERQQYLINAYRVLLTRARQGMVIFVPTGDTEDHTRLPAFYDETYRYLLSTGIQVL